MPQSIGGGSSSAGSYTSTPENLQLSSYTNLAPSVAGGLGNVFNLGPNGVQVAGGQLSPFQVAGQSSGASTNPLVAQVTPQQQATLGNIGQLGNNQPLGAAFGAVNNFLNPNFASGLATSPQTQQAVSAALQPIQQQFRTQTVPGLVSGATQAGQRVQGSGGMGSSGFANAAAAAQGNLAATEAQTAGSIVNNAYQTGLNIQAQAPTMAAGLTTTELNNMIQTLNAQALPQLTQQYGISAGTQLYQQNISDLLQSLGLGGQISQPAIAYQSQSQNTSSASPGLMSGIGSGLQDISMASSLLGF